jgi:hypothetical protein
MQQKRQFHVRGSTRKHRSDGARAVLVQAQEARAGTRGLNGRLTLALCV